MSIASPWRYRVVQRSMPISKFNTLDDAIRTANRYEKFVRYVLWHGVERSRIWRQIKHSDDIYIIKNDDRWLAYVRLHNRDVILKSDDLDALISESEGLVRAFPRVGESSGSGGSKPRTASKPARTKNHVDHGEVKGGHRRMSNRPIDYFMGKRLPVGITVRELASRPGWYTVTKTVSGRVKSSVNVREGDVMVEVDRVDCT
ncbi:hypothetical protein AADX40_15515 [Aeromonas veronii]|uniref:hypothetical protein n=1 Tax=Aeromonas TaxID=642 RepID=UPI0031586308